MPCIATRLCAVSLRPPARDVNLETLGEYYQRRVTSPWPFGFPSLATYEAAVAGGHLVLEYAKDADLEEEKSKKTGTRRGKKKQVLHSHSPVGKEEGAAEEGEGEEG